MPFSYQQSFDLRGALWRQGALCAAMLRNVKTRFFDRDLGCLIAIGWPLAQLTGCSVIALLLWIALRIIFFVLLEPARALISYRPMLMEWLMPACCEGCGVAFLDRASLPKANVADIFLRLRLEPRMCGHLFAAR